MMYTVTVENAFSVSLAREHALEQVVLNDKDLHEKFRKTMKDNIFVLATDEYIVKLDEFIESEGLRIVSEEPKVRVNENGHYIVDVEYMIEK